MTEKRLVVTEEIRITRVPGTHRMPQQVELRREQIDIEKLEPPGPGDVASAEASAASADRARTSRR